MSAPAILVFCDGAAKGNPGPGGWGVIVVTPDGRVVERGGRAAHTTNNKMELTAAIEAFAHAGTTAGAMAVYTDSTYVIKGIKEWIWNWRRRGWKTAEGADVQNQDLWRELDALVSARPRGSVSWHYVRGHAGIPGNERVDAIADGFARGAAVDLYDGPLVGYAVPIFDVPDDTAPPPSTSRTRSAKTAAHSYISLVDGTPMRHATWAECERRVKGRSGARFKKAVSASDEQAILRSWNVAPSDLVQS